MANRSQMLGMEIQRVLAEALRKIKDPRFTELTTVLEVTTSLDLEVANVLLSIYSNDEDKKKQTFEAVKRASGFLRSEVAKNMKIRKAPELKFTLDRSAEYSAHINSILHSLDIKPEQ